MSCSTWRARRRNAPARCPPQPAVLAMHFDDTTRNSIELPCNQHARRRGNFLAQSRGELIDAVQAFCCNRGARRAHHTDLYRLSLHGPLQAERWARRRLCTVGRPVEVVTMCHHVCTTTALQTQWRGLLANTSLQLLPQTTDHLAPMRPCRWHDLAGERVWGQMSQRRVAHALFGAGSGRDMASPLILQYIIIPNARDRSRL